MAVCEGKMNENTRLRQQSIKSVLRVLCSGGPLSKRELQNITGFSWGNISSITSGLLEQGLIVASGKQDTFVGRKPEAFDININDNYIIGIDFNIAGVLAVVCDLKGRVIKSHSAPFINKNKDAVLDTLYGTLGSALASCRGKKVAYIAIAMQGEVDADGGISVHIHGIEGWRDVPVCELLQKKFGKPTAIFHDPDCLLYAERRFGLLSSGDTENAILLRIDHGVGIAAMLNDKIYMGTKGKTCEIGTTVVPYGDESGWAYFDDIVTEKAIAKRYRKLTRLNKRVDAIARFALEGDQNAKRVFNEIGVALALALNNACSLLNPERVVLFGSFCRNAELFLGTTEKRLGRLMKHNCPSIVLSRLDNGSAAVGAALFVAERVIDGLELTI